MDKNTVSAPGLSRRDFLATGALATAAAAAAALIGPDATHGAEGRIGDWSADGAPEGAPASDVTNASAADGTYREHNPACFPANDASPIPPR